MSRVQGPWSRVQHTHTHTHKHIEACIATYTGTGTGTYTDRCTDTGAYPFYAAIDTVAYF